MLYIYIYIYNLYIYIIFFWLGLFLIQSHTMVAGPSPCTKTRREGGAATSACVRAARRRPGRAACILPSAGLPGAARGRGGGETRGEDPLCPADLASRSAETWGSFSQRRRPGWRGRRAGGWPGPLPSHGARWGAALGAGGLRDRRAVSRPPQTAGLRAVFSRLGSAPTLLLTM